jgi:cell division septum initiation protein DivIVA
MLQRRHRELAERLARGAERRGATDADPDVIQRTLVLAQKTADEAVAEARARAEAMVGTAEARASSLVTEAEATARRVGEAERTRLEAEVGELCAARDALTADLDKLERFAASYRERIRSLITAELDRIGVSLGDLAPSVPRPELSLRAAGLGGDPEASAAPALRSALDGALAAGTERAGP